MIHRKRLITWTLLMVGAVLASTHQTHAAEPQSLARLLVTPSVAKDLGDYTVRWQAALSLPAHETVQSIEVLGDRIAVFETGNLVSVIHNDNGKILWRAPVGKKELENFSSPRRYLNGLVLCSETRAHVFDIDQGEMMAIYPLAHTVRSSPIIYEGMMVHGAANGVLYAQELERGLLVWEYNMRAPINTAPVLSGSTLIATTDRGEVAAFNPRNGVLLWRETTFQAIGATPATEHLMAFVPSTDQSLYAFDRNVGKIRWRHFEKEPLTMSPTALGQLVLQFVPNKGLIAFDAFTGQIRWTRSDIPSYAQPVMTKDNVVYVFYPNKEVAMLAVKDGLTVRRVATPKVERLLTNNPNGGDLYLLSHDGRVMKLLK